MRRVTILSLIFVLAAAFVMPSAVFAASTGKIAGKVTDKDTGEGLPGANVVIEGTTRGAVTDINGEYFILNVTPGLYTLVGSMVGYHKVTQSGVRVNIDLTATLNFTHDNGLVESSIELTEIMVVATRPVVQADISANVANITSEDVEGLPITSVNEAVTLQAGVLADANGDLSIRGSDLNEISFTVDGMSMRDGRDNTPYSTVSFTSIKEMSIQSGGFNAEYGNVRSGLVNIVTKEGSTQRYNSDILMRYSGAQRDYFGPLPNDPNGYFWRPYTDSDVKNVGTHSDLSKWDVYRRRQYPQWAGWQTIIGRWASVSADPYHGMGVLDTGVDESKLPIADLQVDDAAISELFLWYRRKELDVKDPDYDLDGSFGGPLIPTMGNRMGGVRFLASAKRERRAYMMPRVIDSYENDWGRIKVTADITQNMKLSVEGMFGEELGLNPNRNGSPNMWRGNQEMGVQARSLRDYDSVWADHLDNTLRIQRNNIGLSLTHVLSPKTFYEFRIQRMNSDYLTDQLPERDLKAVVQHFNRNSDFAIPTAIQQVTQTTQTQIGVTEAPLGGWFMKNEIWVDGLEFGGHWAQNRDHSQVDVWTTRFDITSQRTQVAQFKAGFEVAASDYNINHETAQPFFKNNSAPKFIWERNPRQMAAYVQAKLEFNAMVANLGVRWDRWDANGDWWVYDDWTFAFSSKFGKDALDGSLEQAPVKKLNYLSPRLGISFPVTADSKLFFNYGHFRQMLNPHNLFIINEVNTGAVTEIGNPAHPMPRTINYELGFEQNLFDKYLLRINGYYKANDDQASGVTYTNLDQSVNYALFEPLSYDDIRGFEITVRKRRGKWVGGFVNYTFLQTKGGNFGFANVFENRLEQSDFIANTRSHYQNKPVSRPFGRLALELYTPRDYGPQVSSFYPAGNWDLTLLANWRAGRHQDWFGPEASDIPGLTNNVQWKSFKNVDLRLAKRFEFLGARSTFFLDIDNFFNLKHLNRGSADPQNSDRDWQAYMVSLHLPADTFKDDLPPYFFVPGNDGPGTFRESDTYVPIEIVANSAGLPANGLTGDAEISTGLPTGLEPDRRVLWYLDDTQQYMEYRSGSWSAADESFVNEVLDKKLYIDMPNNQFTRFLGPRRVIMGLRFSF
ncbi:MAG: TonB-dependent receptor [bacterium]|nr:TonB-dependent receptor [bacterium]